MPIWRCGPVLVLAGVADGCHFTRDPTELVRAAGFEIERVESRYATGPKPWTWLTEGAATKPGRAAQRDTPHGILNERSMPGSKTEEPG